MDGWVYGDGLEDGLVDRWKDGWMRGLVDRWMDGWVDEWMEG